MARSKRRRFTSGGNVRPGTMTFEPILEEGVFRFDCSVNVRDAVPPSISFLNTNDRDISIYSEKVPLYTPTFACRSEKQVVKLEVSYLISFWLISFGCQLVIVQC